ncbi:uncharacterized protein [Anabrus simplex]|uniref:uncharacterized protein n=1 Tax=Anabrus simplex TaxID=316456 RepID=UPI0035A33B7F
MRRAHRTAYQCTGQVQHSWLKEYESSIHPKYNNYLYPIDVYQNPLIGEDITQQFTKIIKDKLDKPDASYRMKKTRHKHSMNQYVSSDQNKKINLTQFDVYQNPMIGEDITQQFSKIIKEKLQNSNIDAPHKREVGNQNQQQQDESAVQTESPAEVQSSRRIPEGLAGYQVGRISRRQGSPECSEAEQSEQSLNDDEEDDSSRDSHSSNSYLKQNLNVQYPSVRGADMMSVVSKISSESNIYPNGKSESKPDLEEEIHPGIQSLRQSGSHPEESGGSMDPASGDAGYKNHSSLAEVQKAPYANSDGEGTIDQRMNLAHLQSNSQGKLLTTTTPPTSFIFLTNKTASHTVSGITAMADSPVLGSVLQVAQRLSTAPKAPHIQSGRGSIGGAPNVGAVMTQIYDMLVGADTTSRINIDCGATGSGGYELKAREKEVQVRFFGNPSTSRYPRYAANWRELQEGKD